VGATSILVLPKTKAWILSEIANGWNPNAYPVEDQLDCLLFLSMAADGALCGSDCPYASAFDNIHGGWNEVVKCVRNLLREREAAYTEKDLARVLQNPFLQQTAFTALTHALIARVARRGSGRRALRAMFGSVTW
jgi:hypothetical protein